MKIIKRIILLIKIRAAQAYAQGQADTMQMVRCRETRTRMEMSHINALAEIDRLKAEYRRLERGRGIQAITGLKGGAA